MGGRGGGGGGGVGAVGGGGGRGRGQGGCERRIEVFVKIQKKRIFFWGGGGVWGHSKNGRQGHSGGLRCWKGSHSL